jgi:hypothetical protein
MREKMVTKKIQLICISSVILLLTSCVINPEKYYAKAKKNRNIELYEKFIDKYPNDSLLTTVKQELYLLEFIEAKHTRDLKYIQLFLLKYPEGDSTVVVKNLADDLRFENAKTMNTIKAINEFIMEFPNSKYIEQACKNKEFLTFEKAKEQNTYKAFKDYINLYPKGDSLNIAQKCADELVLPTIIATEDINLLEKYKSNNFDLREQGHIVLDGQKALLSGNFKSFDIDRIEKSNSRYGKELVEILLAIQSSSTPSIFDSVKIRVTEGRISSLISLLQEMQSIVDNRLLRHTMGQFLYDASKNIIKHDLYYYTEWDLKKLQHSILEYKEQVGSGTLNLCSIDQEPDFGNIMENIPYLTMLVQASSIGEKNWKDLQFSGLPWLDQMKLQGQIMNIINAIDDEVILEIKILLGQRYNKLGIKGRYAVLQWLEYLINDIDLYFYGTFKDRECDVSLKKAIDIEQDVFFKEMGERILSELNEKGTLEKQWTK